MHVHVDAHNGIPIYEQIARQVKYSVASGALQVGEHVPSVREMAGRLAVNPNTVARAYRDLQADGVLLPIRGTGLSITPQAVELCLEERLDLIRGRLRSALAEGRQAGMDADELRTLVEEELSQLAAAEVNP